MDYGTHDRRHRCQECILDCYIRRKRWEEYLMRLLGCFEIIEFEEKQYWMIVEEVS